MKNGVFSVKGGSSATTLCLCGEISDKELPELSRYIETCLDAGGISNIYIDLSDVKLLTPKALAFLIDQTDRFRAFSTKLWIQSPKPEITAMLDLGGDGRFLNMTQGAA
jgi:anti-anti-sigma factor